MLRGELELAGRPGRSREELPGAVAHASEEAARLARITEQLLFLARADEDKIPPRRQPTDISGAAGQQRGAGRQPRTPGGHLVTCKAPAGLVADVDPGRIREAVDNLVDNALRFAPPGTSIVLAARAAGGDLIDRGQRRRSRIPGRVPAARLRALPRPDSGRARSDGGAGLGLAIVSAIAHAHHGRARASNSPRGAVVTLELPGAADPTSRHEGGGKR